MAESCVRGGMKIMGRNKMGSEGKIIRERKDKNGF